MNWWESPIRCQQKGIPNKGSDASDDAGAAAAAAAVPASAAAAAAAAASDAAIVHPDGNLVVAMVRSELLHTE